LIGWLPSNKQETDDAILALQSCAGEPARQLAAEILFLALAGPGSLAVFLRISWLIRTRSRCARAFPTRERNMNRKRSSKRQMQSLCGEIHPDDGIDPKEFFRPTRKQNGNHRKAYQLCHQVADTLSLALSGETGDELRDLRVVSVSPAPDASQLLVLVAPAVEGISLDPNTVAAKLAAAAGRLRSEVAAAVTRKRAPKLLFQFVGQAGLEVRP
jgi:ribosome-binding factor A